MKPVQQQLSDKTCETEKHAEENISDKQYDSEATPKQDELEETDACMITSVEFYQESVKVVESVCEKSGFPGFTYDEVISERDRFPISPLSDTDESGIRTNQQISTPAFRQEKCKSPEIMSTVGNETMASAEETMLYAGTLSGKVETDLLSFDDQGDTSSVESFPTVVPLQDDVDEDRLADIASDIAAMTSSFHSEMHVPCYDIHFERSLENEGDHGILDRPDIGEFEVPSVAFHPLLLTDTLQSEDDDSCLIPTVLDAIKEEEEKVSSSQKTTSSSDKLETDTTTSDSSKVFESSLDAHSQRLSGKSTDKDDAASVSSSLLEFEHLEQEILKKGSLESVTVAINSSHLGRGRTIEKDNISVSSSLAEFEHLEKELQSHSDSAEMVGSESKSCGSSVSEFDKITASNEQIVKSLRSSASSLAEFERLEHQLCMVEELETEAKKVANLLEQGSLPITADELESDNSQEKETLASDASLVLKSAEALVEPSVTASAVEYPPYQDIVQIIREASQNVGTFNFQETQEESMISSKPISASIAPSTEQTASVLDIERTKSEDSSFDTYKDNSDIAIPIVSSAARMHVIKYENQSFSTEVHIEENLDQAHVDDDVTDSLDEEVSSEMFVTERLIEIGLQEKESTDVDADSLQDTESHKSFAAVDTDSFADQDYALQLPADYYDLETTCTEAQYGSLEQRDLQERIQVEESKLIDPLFMSSDSLQIESFDIVETSQGTVDEPAKRLGMEGTMVTSTDSLDLECVVPVKFHTQGDAMNRSTDSLEFGSKNMPESQSCDSFETDSLHGEQTVVITSISQDSLKEMRISSMDMSIESGAWTQSSFSSATLISSGRDIMQASLDSEVQDKISNTDTSPYTSASEGKQLVETELGSMFMSRDKQIFTQTSSRTDDLPVETLAVFDAEGNVMPCRKDAKTNIDDEGNLHYGKKLHEQDSKVSGKPDFPEEYELQSKTDIEPSVMQGELQSYGFSVKSIPVDSFYSESPYPVPSEKCTGEGETHLLQPGSSHAAHVAP